MTRSGRQRLQCCVCHLHHQQAMKALHRVRQFFGTVLQKVHHFKVDVIARYPNAAAYKYYKKLEYQDLYNSSVAVMLREMQREVNTGRPFESRLYILIILPKIIFLSFPQHVILIVASWLFSHGETRIMRKLWSNTRERTQSKETEQAEDSSYPRHGSLRVLLLVL